MTDSGRRDRIGFLRGLLGRFTRKSAPQTTTNNQHQVTCGDRTVAISPEVRASAHEDGLALLHIQTGRVFLCNRIGSRIWQSLAKGLSADAIVEQISRECGVARDLVAQHTSSFLAELERRGLVSSKVEKRPGLGYYKVEN